MPSEARHTPEAGGAGESSSGGRSAGGEHSTGGATAGAAPRSSRPPYCGNQPLALDKYSCPIGDWDCAEGVPAFCATAGQPASGESGASGAGAGGVMSISGFGGQP